MKKAKLILLLSMFCTLCNAQIYSDYIGAGHSEGITVSSSSDSNEGVAQSTIDGKGMDVNRYDASRFLAQASFGSRIEDIDALAETLDFEGWIDDQIALPPSNYLETVNTVWDTVKAMRIASGVNPDDLPVAGANHIMFNYAWWQTLIDGEDQLRQRVAWALSQIFVISNESDIRGHGIAAGAFLDLMMDNAFGNYQDLLMDVTLSPSMGYYLSHYNNPKEVPEENIHPDQNYAREIMQLFSIGLYELNIDGSRVKDSNGNDIPTYDNDDIAEMANVFTGLGAAGVSHHVTWTDTPYFGLYWGGSDKTIPMTMYDDFHETKEKNIMGGQLILPEGQSGMEDIEQTVEFLANHDNTGPFIAIRLIQRLVKSNPSPEYITRVAEVFNNNGSGVRGDMAAVVKAILLDEEARNCLDLLDDFSPRLREPINRYAHVAKSLELDSPFGRYWNSSIAFLNDTKQIVLYSPTVFNFYAPDYHPVGVLSDNDYYAPEFFLHNTATATAYINRAYSWAFSQNAFLYSWEDDYGDVDVKLVTSELEVFAGDPEKLMQELDLRFTHGQLSDETRNTIRTAVEGLPDTWEDWEWKRTRLALYLILISPDYNIMR